MQDKTRSHHLNNSVNSSQPASNADNKQLLNALHIGGFAQVALKETHKLFEKSMELSGQVVDRLGNIWLIRKLAGVLNLNWLVGAASNVNLEKAKTDVQKLQKAYPNESPRQIAHRIMVEKATKAGGIGLATSMLPGIAVALLAIDLAATTELQSEMVYQIAAVYGLDLNEPTRKGEVLAIFGLALGGGRLLKAAGLGLLRNVPFAGAAIAASSNATMIYSLGYAACRFYETKLDAATELNSEETLTTLKLESEDYLKNAIAQEAIMDRILVQMILTSHPDRTWQEILPQLQALHLSPHSLEAIIKHAESPQPIEKLVEQLNPDFAVTLLAQCSRIANLNGSISPEEQKIIDAISAKVRV